MPSWSQSIVSQGHALRASTPTVAYSCCKPHADLGSRACVTPSSRRGLASGKKAGISPRFLHRQGKPVLQKPPDVSLPLLGT